MEVVWGHDTDVIEAVVRNFNGNWTGTGTIENPGSSDTERLALDAGEYMISEVVHTDATKVKIEYNVYSSGDTINLDYRHGESPVACETAEWQDYTGSFDSLGYLQIRVTSTL
jgi:hypothetical protein